MPSSPRRVAAVLTSMFVSVVPDAAPAQSQSDVVYVGGRTTSTRELDDRAGSRHDVSGLVMVSPPSLLLGEHDRLNLGFSYRYTGINLQAGAVYPDEPTHRRLHAIDLNAGYSRSLGQRWSLSFGVVPGVRSDLKDSFGERDVQVGAFALATYLVGGDPHFRLSLGLAAQTHWALAPVFPFAALDYRSDRVALSVAASGLSAVLRIEGRGELGLFGSLGADWYRVAPAGASPLRGASSLRILEVAGGLQLNFATFDSVWLDVRAGYILVRSGTFGDGSRSALGGISLDTAPVFFGQVGFSVRDEQR